jgi:hypothetical protein
MKPIMKLVDYASKKPSQDSLVSVMGRISPELVRKAKPVMKKNRITWNSLIEASLRMLLEEDRSQK